MFELESRDDHMGGSPCPARSRRWNLRAIAPLPLSLPSLILTTTYAHTSSSTVPGSMLGIGAERFENEWAVFDREALDFANQTQSMNPVRQLVNDEGERRRSARGIQWV